MSSKLFFLLSIIGLVFLTITPLQVLSVCCHQKYSVIDNLLPPRGRPLTYHTISFCGDGTKPTPNCGYGKCNLFGCACQGDRCRADPMGNWKTGEVSKKYGGQVHWSNGCDLNGYDIASYGSISNVGDCASRCLSNSACNAFTHNSNTRGCYLKKVPKNYARRQYTTASCGIIHPRY